MTRTPLHNYPVAPPNPWCQGCGIDFERDEYPVRVDGRDYHPDCIERYHAQESPR